MLSLAAGTVLDAGPVEVIESAAAAGFDACGLRLNPGETSGQAVATIARSLTTTGIRLLDLEVIRMRPGTPAVAHRPLIDLAAQLGAAWVLTVTEIPDEHERIDRLAELADLATAAGVGISLEFMAFTAVRTLADAVAAVAAVPSCRILVDALHLARTGGAATDVAPHSGRLSYVQLCDAPRTAPEDGPDGLAAEARHDRLLPGTGQLDLSGLVAAVPATVPFSIEVQSDRLAAELSVRQRAEVAFRAGAAVVAAR